MKTITLHPKHSRHCGGLGHVFPCWMNSPAAEAILGFLVLAAVIGGPACWWLHNFGARLPAAVVGGLSYAWLAFLFVHAVMRRNKAEGQRDTAWHQTRQWEKAFQDSRVWYSRCCDWRALARHLAVSDLARATCDQLQEQHAAAGTAALPPFHPTTTQQLEVS